MTSNARRTRRLRRRRRKRKSEAVFFSWKYSFPHGLPFQGPPASLPSPRARTWTTAPAARHDRPSTSPRSQQQPRQECTARRDGRARPTWPLVLPLVARLPPGPPPRRSWLLVMPQMERDQHQDGGLSWPRVRTRCCARDRMIICCCKC